MKQDEFNQLFEVRTKILVMDIISMFSELKCSVALGFIIKQLIRSTTSVAANHSALRRAACERKKC